MQILKTLTDLYRIEPYTLQWHSIVSTLILYLEEITCGDILKVHVNVTRVMGGAVQLHYVGVI